MNIKQYWLYHSTRVRIQKESEHKKYNIVLDFLSYFLFMPFRYIRFKLYKPRGALGCGKDLIFMRNTEWR